MLGPRSRRYDGFFLNSPLAAFMFDLDGRVVHWNPAAETIFGWKAAEVIGEFLPIVPPSALDEFLRLKRVILDGGKVTGYETIRRRKDGSSIAVRISAAPFRDASGKIVGMMAMLEDLSATRALERSVAEANRLLLTLVEASPVAVIVADASRTIRIWNGAAARMYGWTAEELVGQPVESIVATAAGRLLAELGAEPHAGQTSSTVVRETRRDGTEFDAWPAAAAVADGESRLATMALVRDVTAQVEAERRAKQASEELRALSMRMIDVLEEERARISREIHDELGQLLTGVRFDLEAIRNGLGDNSAVPRLSHAIDTIVQAHESVRRIAADLRPPLLDTFGLDAAIQAEVAEFEARTGIECNLSLPPDEPQLHGEVATAVYRVVQEALTNVGRHAAARSVDIRLRQRDHTLYVEVRDDGKGIDPKRTRSGALGLVGMRERATRLGGELRVEPGRPRGTVVTLVMPLGEST